jgi:tRNA (guanine-N(7)-)-methyltransferase subunit TRM82
LENQADDHSAMPKRPCAIAMTVDDATIVCADKFGDVYSLPLLISTCSKDLQQAEEQTQASLKDTGPPKRFIPAANDLTVHSIRNRKTLQNQMRQTQHKSEKQEPDFERNLLLGHVSMLTDIALVARNGRSYIITADRDEHIRISRGIPQAHITEGYCMGHKSFVSRLCLPTTRSNILISGGGDDEIYIWDWLHGKLLHSIDLRSHAREIVHDSSKSNGTIENNGNVSEHPKLAVSSISHVVKGPGQQHDTVIVTCEA